jgi:hypothetical protein
VHRSVILESEVNSERRRHISATATSLADERELTDVLARRRVEVQGPQAASQETRGFRMTFTGGRVEVRPVEE